MSNKGFEFSHNDMKQPKRLAIRINEHKRLGKDLVLKEEKTGQWSVIGVIG